MPELDHIVDVSEEPLINGVRLVWQDENPAVVVSTAAVGPACAHD